MVNETFIFCRPLNQNRFHKDNIKQLRVKADQLQEQRIQKNI